MMKKAVKLKKYLPAIGREGSAIVWELVVLLLKKDKIRKHFNHY